MRKCRDLKIFYWNKNVEIIGEVHERRERGSEKFFR